MAQHHPVAPTLYLQSCKYSSVIVALMPVLGLRKLVRVLVQKLLSCEYKASPRGALCCACACLQMSPALSLSV